MYNTNWSPSKNVTKRRQQQALSAEMLKDHVSVSFILERARKAEDTKSVRRVLNH